MKIIYAIARVMVFGFLIGIITDVPGVTAEFTDDAVLCSLAIVFAGGMGGGDR